jgi:glutamate/tyrosine decarboxylase-like PLP-dependent enzyme
MRPILEEALEAALRFLAGSAEAPAVGFERERPACDDVLPETGSGAIRALDAYLSRYGEHHGRSTGPRYFGFVTGGVTPAALAADWLVSTFDQNVATERHSIAAAVENRALQWIADLLGLPEGRFHGVFTTGATAANLVCLASAREWCGERQGLHHARDGFAEPAAVRVFGAAPHSSILKVMGILGMGQGRVQRVASLPGREAVDVAALERALATCEAPGRIVVASAGTVDTGDFDDLRAVADLCRTHGAWMHVDGAFGAFARCSPAYADLAAGIEEADSITLDGHKWLNVPYDCGIALTRHPLLNERAFSVEAPYVPADGVMPSFMNRGIEQSRRFRALPVFLTLAAYGRAGHREVVERNCGFARALCDWIDGGDLFETVAETRLNVVAFKGRWLAGADGGALDRAFVRKLNQSGRCFVTPSTYKGAFVVRLAVANWRTGEDDLEIVKNALIEAHTATAPAMKEERT